MPSAWVIPDGGRKVGMIRLGEACETAGTVHGTK